MKRLFLLFLAVATLSQAVTIDGMVVNKTVGKPADGVAISLVRPGQNGMAPVASSKTDETGHFRFEAPSAPPGPQLLQANYDGINYNKLLTPNMATQAVEVDIFDSSKTPAGVVVSQHLLIFDANNSQISVNETVMLQNSTNKTFRDPKNGEFLFYLPAAANGQVRISAQGPGGMPLPRPAEKTNVADVFRIDFPIKPGDSQFEIIYTLPVGTPFTFQGRIVNVKGMASSPLRLVAPPGVTLSGDNLQTLGTEPKTQATIYNVSATNLYSVAIAGTGGFRSADSNAGAQDDSDSPPVTEGLPQIYSHLTWLIALCFVILGVGFIYLFRNSPLSPSGK